MAAVVSAAEAWYGQIRASERGRKGGTEGGEESVEMRESVGLGGIDGRGRGRKGEVRERQTEKEERDIRQVEGWKARRVIGG